MRRLIGLILAALFVSSFSAWAGSPPRREPATIRLRLTRFGINGTIQCFLAPFKFRSFTFPSPSQPDMALDSPRAELRSDQLWALSVENRWKADANLSMEQMFKPPNGVSLFVTQTTEDMRGGGIESKYKPNSTLGAIELVIHTDAGELW